MNAGDELQLVDEAGDTRWLLIRDMAWCKWPGAYKVIQVADIEYVGGFNDGVIETVPVTCLHKPGWIRCG